MREETSNGVSWLTSLVGSEIQAVVYLHPDAVLSGSNAAVHRFLGRSAWERILHQLVQNGTRCVAVIGRVDPATFKVLQCQTEDIVKADTAVCHIDAPSIEASRHDMSAHVLVAQANLVCDERLLSKLAAHPGPAKLVSESGRTLGLAKLHSGMSRLLVCQEGIGEQLAGLDEVAELDVASVSAYLPGMRRTVAPYWQLISGQQDLEAAARKVMDRAQKGVLDFPARYLHPFAENHLAALAARTNITPNQITVFSGIVGFAGTYFFATQEFFIGLLIAIAAGILDGVDGKLARVKLLSSPFGDRLDHIVDVSFEFSWYLAIGWGLYQATGNNDLFAYGFLMIGVMLLNRILSGVYRWQTGREIHDHTAFDRAMRLVAGRRNIYVLLLLAGYLTDQFLASYYLMVIWALATAAVYACRNLVVLAGKLRPIRP